MGLIKRLRKAKAEAPKKVEGTASEMTDTPAAPQ